MRSTFDSLRSWARLRRQRFVTLYPIRASMRTRAKLEKAVGLNLREKSSGEHEGRLSITKRGPGLLRRLLYLFAFGDR